MMSKMFRYVLSMCLTITILLQAQEKEARNHIISSLPATIVEPGNYTLEGDLTLDPTRANIGILIESSDVTLDLQQHTITIPDILEGQAIMIFAVSNVTIKNGTITAPRISSTLYNDGMEITGSRNVLVEDMIFSHTSRGIAMWTNRDITVKNCTFKKISTSIPWTGLAISAHGTRGNLTISDCTFLDMKSSSATKSNCIYINKAQDTKIHHCTYQNCDRIIDYNRDDTQIGQSTLVVE